MTSCQMKNKKYHAVDTASMSIRQMVDIDKILTNVVFNRLNQCCF